MGSPAILWIKGIGIILSIVSLPERAKIATFHRGLAMKSMSARDAKNGFGKLLDYAQAEPVQVEKHGRAVVVVLSVNEFARLNASGGEKMETTGGVSR